MRLSRKMGPRARRLAGLNDSHLVEGVVEITRDADIPQLTRKLESLGAHVHVPPVNTGYLRIDVPAQLLYDVAAASGVLYVEASELLAGARS